MVIWNDHTIHLIELTVPFETGMDAAADRKRAKYADLLASCTATCHTAHLTTVEVGSRGFINATSFDRLYRLLSHSKPNEQRKLEAEVVRSCILQSYDIWCQRNWQK